MPHSPVLLTHFQALHQMTARLHVAKTAQPARSRDRAAIAALLVFVLASAGCSTLRGKGPVASDVAECRALTQQGITALQGGQPNVAEAQLAKAVEICPSCPDARSHYGEVLWNLGRHAEALRQIEAALEADPSDAALAARAGAMYFELKQYKQANRLADRALAADPNLAAAWSLKGSVEQATGDNRPALAAYQRALQTRPGDLDVLMEMAHAYHRQQQPHRALAALQRAEELYAPGEEPQQLLAELGQTYLALQRYEDAVESLTLACSRSPVSVHLLHRLAEAESLAGRNAAAISTARRALAVDPNFGPSRDLVARLAPATSGEEQIR